MPAEKIALRPVRSGYRLRLWRRRGARTVAGLVARRATIEHFAESRPKPSQERTTAFAARDGGRSRVVGIRPGGGRTPRVGRRQRISRPGILGRAESRVDLDQLVTAKHLHAERLPRR